MKTFNVAHRNVRGQQMVIVPLNGQWAQNASPKQIFDAKLFIQNCAHEAGLAGTVCLVWQFGRDFYYDAPKPWHPFFRSLDMATVTYNLNNRLSCPENADYLYKPQPIESYPDMLPTPDTKEENDEGVDSNSQATEQDGNNKTA